MPWNVFEMCMLKYIKVHIWQFLKKVPQGNIRKGGILDGSRAGSKMNLSEIHDAIYSMKITFTSIIFNRKTCVLKSTGK